MTPDELRSVLLQSNPSLSRFDPLARIVFHDDFDNGLCGWTMAVGNYENSLDTMLPEYRGWRTPMISNCTVWDSGTTGSMDGNYAMKLATRPAAGSLSQCMKRLTRRLAGPVRIEYCFSFKPEASRLRLSDRDVRAIGFGFDLQESDLTPSPRRVHPMVRFLSCYEGKRVHRWQYKDIHEPFHGIGETGETVSFCPYVSRGWKDLPGGGQDLCYNELPTKFNWHYFAMDFDLGPMRYIRMRCNDHIIDLSGIDPIAFPAMPNLWNMFQPFVWVEADADNRAFAFIDSAVLSVEAM